jgi:hypothetical protein
MQESALCANSCSSMLGGMVTRWNRCVNMAHMYADWLSNWTHLAGTRIARRVAAASCHLHPTGMAAAVGQPQHLIQQLLQLLRCCRPGCRLVSAHWTMGHLLSENSRDGAVMLWGRQATWGSAIRKGAARSYSPLCFAVKY